MNTYHKNGVRKDNRLEFSQKRHTFEGIVQWLTTPTPTKFTPVQRNQEGNPDSSSCVAQSIASLINAQLGIVASAKPIFDKRIGAPTSDGMYLYDAFNIMETTGTCLESEETSERMNDVQLDTPDTVINTIFAVKGSSVQVPLDADSVASAIYKYGGVVMTFESNESEWDMPNCTPVYNGTPETFGHAICEYIAFINDNGVQVYISEDSDGQWSSPTGERDITVDFMLKRATGCMTAFFEVRPVNQPTPVLDGFNITQQLGFLSIGKQVYLLQNRLVQDGFGAFMPTGFFGIKTQTALKSYQQAHGLPVTGITDSTTIAYMQKNG